MIVPAAVFHRMPERVSCGRGSFSTGAVLAGQDHTARYVRSIAKILDRSGQIVGWVYLADDYHTDRAEYVQANARMTKSDLNALRLRYLPQVHVSNVSLLRSPLPLGLRVEPCK